MVEVEVFTLLGNSAHLKLHGIIDFNLHQDPNLNFLSD